MLDTNPNLFVLQKDLLNGGNLLKIRVYVLMSHFSLKPRYSNFFPKVKEKSILCFHLYKKSGAKDYRFRRVIGVGFWLT